jgi:glutamate/aspartate transport system substrate-binding protein
LFAVGLLATCFAIGAHAQELTGTLKKIKDGNAVVLGVRESSIPFSYLDDKQQSVGYAIDLCTRVVDAIRKHLNAPGLELRQSPVTSQTRIPLMVNGTIDLECGSTTNSVERQRQVAFSNTFYVAAARIMVPRNGAVRTPADLRGRTVVSTSGGNTVRHLQRYSDDNKLDLKLPQAKDHAEAWLLMETGRADAVANDDVLLYGLRANSKSPQDFVVLPMTLSTEPYGIMMRRDDSAFKNLVDDTLSAMFRSGEAERLYAKWFLNPVPPRGVNLNLPVSDELREAFRQPNDRGAP